MKSEIKTPAGLSEILHYDPATGKLTWKCRALDTFSPEATQRTASNWNMRFAGKEAFTRVSTEGYRSTNIIDRYYAAHRVAWAIYYGVWPNGEIDHINGDRQDNRIANLRDVAKIENAKNMRRSRANTSGFAGVRLHACGRWEARLSQRSLGLFGSAQEASRARVDAARMAGYHPNHGGERVGA